MIEHLNWLLAAAAAVGVGITTLAVVYLVMWEHPAVLRAFHKAFEALLAAHKESEAANRKAFEDRSAQDRQTAEKLVDTMNKISNTQIELSTLIRVHGTWDGTKRRENDR